MGLLRPATPLAVTFFVAFVLLLLSTLSTPIIHAIPLGSYQGWNFGVFGYCKGTQCSGYKIGYSTDGLFTGNNAGDFELPSATRHSLSAILIVHPIAAFLTLVCFGLACAAHFHSAAHSPRYLLALLILTVPTLLVTLLAFLVDILLFVPHMEWGGWIVLGATILIIVSSVITCAMRRTLVSRKARKKRIAENADMSGANYYENLHQNRLMADELPKADSPPPMSGSTAVDKGVPAYAAFEMKRHEGSGGSADAPMTSSNDDRTPLNPTRDPSVRSASTGGGARRPYGQEDAPPMPMGRPSVDSNGNGMPPRRPSRDQYGNVIPAAAMGAGLGAGMAMAGDVPPHLRHQNSRGSMGSNGSGGYGRGRGGYGPPGRGYGPPRGSYGPPGRGGYAPRGSFRGQPPPPGWRGRGGYGPPPGMMGRGGMPRQGPPPGYAPGNDGLYTNPRTAPSPTMDTQSPPPVPDEFIAGPIGQAIEMDERTGSPPGPLSPTDGHASPYGLRDSDGDVAGMVGLQQGRNEMRGDQRRDGVQSQESMYSDHTYVPPRAQWAHPAPLQHHPNDGALSPMGESTSSYPTTSSGPLHSSQVLPLSPIQASPTSPHNNSPHSPNHRRGGSENYYEDVDPRFAIDPASEVGEHAGPLPTALTPGGYGGPAAYGNRMAPHSHPNPQDAQLLQPPSSTHIPSYVSGSERNSGATGGNGNNTDNSTSTPSLERQSQQSQQTGDGRDHSYENLPEGARSPAEGSEASHFTSVSQRGINPNWRPGPGSNYGGGSMMGGGGGAPPSSASAAQRRREDVILNANPDFSLPGMARGRGRGGRGMMGSPRGGPSAMGLTPSGRYPTDI